jgi:uncharacterized protein YndB with AHSA1/START domain
MAASDQPGSATSNAVGEELVVTRVFDAPRELVFKAWAEPERLVRWWGPKGYTTPSCTIDFRPGGAWRFCMRSPEGVDLWCRGVYLEIVEPERIVCTDLFVDEQGNPVGPAYYGLSPDGPSETLITVTFTEHDARTTLTIRQVIGFPPASERDGMQQGWSESLDRLADFLAADGDRT